MANVTISVPDELRAEMDQLTDVNWSEVSRRAIFNYIRARRNPNPRVDFTLLSAEPTTWWGTPAIQLAFEAINQSELHLTLDRALFGVTFAGEGLGIQMGYSAYLGRDNLFPNSRRPFPAYLPLTLERLQYADRKITRTFQCQVNLTAYVVGEGTETLVQANPMVKIPVDEWKNLVKTVTATVVEKA